MNNKSKKISALYLISMMAVGGVCGFLLTSDSIPHPEDLTFNPGIVYDYDIIFGGIGIACLLLTLWCIIGILRISSKTGNEPNQSEEEPTAYEYAVGRLMKISAYNYMTAALWIALCMAYFASREAQANDQEVFLIVNLLGAVVFILVAVLLQSIIVRHYNKLFPDRSTLLFRKLNIFAKQAKWANNTLYSKSR